MTSQSAQTSLRLQDRLVEAVRKQAEYNRNADQKPRAIVWTDKERFWQTLMPMLSTHMPELMVGTKPGEAVPADCQGGPACTVRYNIDRYSGDHVPVVYLPGVDRADFRSPETFPKEYRHLYPMRHLGAFFCTAGDRDWNPVNFLSSKETALGLEVRADDKTKAVVQGNLPELFSKPLAELRGKALDSGALQALLVPDVTRNMLEWLSQGDGIAKVWGEAKWNLFQQVAHNQFKIQPARDGVLTAAEKLVEGGGAWDKVWERFCEAPLQYKGIQSRLSQVVPKSLTFDSKVRDRLPQHNLEREKDTAAALVALADGVPSQEARQRLGELAKQESDRVQGPWATLGMAPLAKALVPLGAMVEAMSATIDPSNWDSLAQGYCEKAWKVDQAARQAFASCPDAINQKLVGQALQAVYKPWLEQWAEKAWQLTAKAPYPMSEPAKAIAVSNEPGSLALFVDGLRADVALQLAEELRSRGQTVATTTAWAALPTVTATAKRAVSPVAESLTGGNISDAFEPMVAGKGKPCKHDDFRAILKKNGIEALSKDDRGDINKAGWLEIGNLDSMGHSNQAKLAQMVDQEVRDLADTIAILVDYGWSRIQVITDHGWLWLPGGLPHVELPGHLTASKWGRCALAKEGSKHGLKEVNWFWDRNVPVVLAPGIGAFHQGTEYAHGGLSLQECLRVHLMIEGAGPPAAPVSISSIKWTGLRLKVAIEGTRSGLLLDIRLKAADASSSVLLEGKPVEPNPRGQGALSADDAHEGAAAFLVVLENGQVIAKQTLTVGEN